MTTGRPTLGQVARRAGVSVSSVSRALNGQSASHETVERVRTAVTELGYVPDATARLLKLGHTPAIACAVPDIANPVYVEMVKAMELVCRRAGYRLSLISVGSDPVEISALVQSLDRGFADGLIITPLRVTDEFVAVLAALAVPAVVLGRIDPEVPVDAVEVDSVAGVRLALDHLLGLGHRSVTLLNGPADTTPGHRRLNAYLDVARERGFAPDVIEADDFTTEAAAAAMGEHFSKASVWPTALWAANDLLALGVMRAARQWSVRVGDELALVGMDDTSLAELVSPSLSSVSLGASQRATLAAELLIQRITHPGTPPARVSVEPELRVRESSSPHKETS